ncbi:MAG: dephospho-CoA kinase [Capnocytophaga sp.]|nr:dephospho-CoA kinase [Capnocytophaga sp.]
MKTIGLTGGIGSGKTTIANQFKEYFSIPIYVADTAAKRVIETNTEVQSKIKEIFGKNAFINKEYNTKYISEIVFNDENMLKKLNNIIHPAVAKDFAIWKEQQTSPYVIKEAAILFESGSYKDCDMIISVIAPLELRIKRVMLRDNIDRKSVENRIKNQWSDEKKIKNSTFVIENIEIDKIFDKIKDIHFKIMKSINENSKN